MLVDFSSLDSTVIPNFKGGIGSVSAKMVVQGGARLMTATIPPGSSIGHHTHETNSEVMFIISGIGKAICDGVEETLVPGTCHFCPIGSSHEVINDGDCDLVMYAAVIGQP